MPALVTAVSPGRRSRFLVPRDSVDLCGRSARPMARCLWRHGFPASARRKGSSSRGSVAAARSTRRSGAADECGSLFPQFRPSTVLAQRDGRIVLVGTVGGGAYADRPSQLGILRLLPDGSRDLSFGTKGFVAWNPPWRVADARMDVFPGLALPQPDGRLLVAATVEERALSPGPTLWERVVLVRFGADGSVDQSFGRQGFAELAWDGGYFRGWARLADGRLVSVVSRHEGGGETLESQAWWLHSFTADGSPAALRSTGSVRLGLNVLNEFTELVPTSDGALLMIGDVGIQHARGPAPAVRRILPDSSLDPTFGRKCGQPLLRAKTGAARPRQTGACSSPRRD